MRITVFGMGHVGSVAAACLAQAGHQVVAVEKDAARLRQLSGGAGPVAEPGLDALIRTAMEAGRLTVTAAPGPATRAGDVSLICVGTPGTAGGDADLRDVVGACTEIGEALASTAAYHLVVVSSTVPPGTTRDVIAPAIAAASGRSAGEGFGVCVSPEFLREGTAVQDYLHPARIVIGASEAHAAQRAAQLWAGFDAPIVHTTVEAAELAKLTDNAWHALKVAFANEIGRLAKALGVDGQAVMEIVTMDSAPDDAVRYLQPGFAFGGSCLPKDLRTLEHRGSAAGVDTPVLRAILPSNALHVEHALRLILDQGRRRIGLLGLSFKPHTDDLRESPLVLLARQLVHAGCDLRIYDPQIVPRRLLDAGRAYVEREAPQLFGLLVDTPEELLAHGEVIVVGKDEPAIRVAVAAAGAGQAVVELVRISESPRAGGGLDGICW